MQHVLQVGRAFLPDLLAACGVTNDAVYSAGMQHIPIAIFGEPAGELTLRPDSGILPAMNPFLQVGLNCR